MSVDDLNYYQIDCSKRDEQIAFLKSQMSTVDDRLSSVFNTASLVGQIGTRIDGSYDQHQAIRNREYDAIARVKIDQLRRCDTNYRNPNICDLARPESPACQNMRRR